MNHFISASSSTSSNFSLGSKSCPDNNLSNSTTKVILVRHARTTYNEQGRYQGSSDESVLTRKGYQTAYSTGLALQQFNFDAIYTSPLTRVQQTTQAIVSVLKETSNHLLPIFIDRKLTEIEMSDWQGLFYQEVKERFPEAYRCWQESPHLFTFDGITYPVLELFEQAQQFWQEVLDKHRGQTILVVAHGGTNRALISTAMGLEPKHYHNLQQSNCGISCLEFREGNSPKLKFLNVTSHLGEKLPKLKAGKTGWRWLLLSNKCTKNILNSSCFSDFIHENLIDITLTDDSHKSESLARDFMANHHKTLYLSINQHSFLENWQKTIFARQKVNDSCCEPTLITGLIIVEEKIIRQILQKTLNDQINLETTNHFSVIHYPQASPQSILQGLFPVQKYLVPQVSYNS